MRRSLEFTVREARKNDASDVALLAAQLGYPVDAAVMERRLAAVEHDAGHVVFVAVYEGAGVGFAHVCRHGSVLYEDYAELAALVVDERRRSLGIGAALLRASEQWARSRGLRMLKLRSRETRVRAHAFYLREGYALLKRQLVFERALDAPPAEAT